MEVIRGLHNLRSRHTGCALGLGGFDGLHVGHQTLIKALINQSKKMGIPSTLISFEPLPGQYFKREGCLRLQSFRDKLNSLNALGLDRVLILAFNETLAMMNADDFIDSVLVKGLGAKAIVVGEDVAFGYKRQGSLQSLNDKASEQDYQVIVQKKVTSLGERLSSTLARKALLTGDFSSLTRILGRPFSVSGRVITGQQRGRLLGFPTANIHCPHLSASLKGVYCANVIGLAKPHQAVVNFGTRPTFKGEHLQLEAHLLNFQGDLYGKRLKVELIAKLRNEQSFGSLEALTQQIQTDIEQSRFSFQNQEAL